MGCVAFVGAGPGDPGLLTVRAVELLAKADLVVTESQDSEFVRRYCREGVEVWDGSLGDDGQPLSHAVRARLVVKAAKSGGSVVRLTPTEWQLLEILVRNSGRLVTQKQLLHEVWGPSYQTESNYLRVYLAQLRRKLEPEPSRPRYLLTESGMGYRFTP